MLIFVARLLRALGSGPLVSVVYHLFGFKVVILVLNSLRPRDLHHAIALGEAYHPHTLGGTTIA